MNLRGYQSALVANAGAHFASGVRAVCAQLPTGGGKGRIIQRVAGGAHAKGRRVIAMAHRIELVEQICANLDDEGIAYGRIQPGWHPTAHPVQVGMVQTIARRLARLPEPHLLLVDEAHHSTAGQYRSIRAHWSRARVLGVTATPTRTDGQGLRDDFDELVLGPPVRELIDLGFLADYEYFQPERDFDAAALPTRAGEYSQAATLTMIAKAKIVGSATQHYVSHLGGRPSIAFCRGVQGAEETAAEFRSAGISSAEVHGEMDRAEVKRRLAALASGELKVVTSADLISEGVDIPAVAGIIMLRPTCSLVHFLQACGRALRPKADGSRAVILDHVNNAAKHGYPADPRAWSLDGVDKAPVPEIRTCGKCSRAFYRNEAVERAAAECKRDRCGILAAPDARDAPVGPDRVDGALGRVTDPWAWAGGIDVSRAQGAEWRALLARAQTEDQLKMIERARGFKRGWRGHIMRERADATA